MSECRMTASRTASLTRTGRRPALILAMVLCCILRPPRAVISAATCSWVIPSFSRNARAFAARIRSGSPPYLSSVGWR